MQLQDVGQIVSGRISSFGAANKKQKPHTHVRSGLI
jgi:hypothetical protein